MDSYQTLAAPASARLTRERSRFLAIVEPTTHDQAAERIAALRRQYHDATHVCSAYRCRSDLSVASHADDAGEPRGSAGTPILLVLEGAQLLDVLAVVVRYFGGVKLGIGGLVRAYSDATAAALAQARIIERSVETTLRIAFPHETNAGVMRAVHSHGARVLEIRYDTQGHATVALSPSRVEAFTDAVREETGARATLEKVP
jgi:uncharacterized YigZ family protein